MKTLWQHFCDEVLAMADGALADITSLDDWERVRPERRREFLDCIGLDPLPPRCELNLADYGEFRGDGYRARRVAYQVLPDCWSSACMYYPDPLPTHPLPAVLYVCGHTGSGTWHYQMYPMRWARRGYACLIVDSLEQSDNTGEHISWLRHRLDGWVSLGYTPAGAEVWNAMRGLDVLAADERVDPDRLAITGQSGGGACSFHTAIADERVQALSTLVGVSTGVDAIVNEHLRSHCECMYPYNLYRRDISEYAALLAPRPAIFCFAEADQLYHPTQTRALVDRVREVYRLYGEPDRCQRVTSPGGHGSHPPFDAATDACFDRHVAAAPMREAAIGGVEWPESVTCVFQGQPPKPNRLHLVPELLIDRGTVPLPVSSEQWPEIREQAVASLPRGLFSPRPNAALEVDGAWHEDGVTRRFHRGHIDGIDVRFETLVSDSASCVFLSVANPGENYLHAFAAAAPSTDRAAVGIAGFTPRMASGVVATPGPEREPGGVVPPSMMAFASRAMLLTGTTRVMMTVHDLRVAIDYLSSQPELDGRRLILYGRGDGGVAGLYAGLLDKRVSGVVVEGAPSSHLDGSPILGVLRRMDINHAVGLMAPRPVALVDPGYRRNWTWPKRVYERLGRPGRFALNTTLRDAIHMMLRET